MRRAGLVLISFGYAVLLFEALRTATAWWQGELEEAGLTEYLLIAALPLLAWIWWRYLSMFRSDCAKGACAPPQDRGDSP